MYREAMSSGLVDPNDPPLPEVERRAAVLRDFVATIGLKVTAEVADGVLAQLGSPRSTLFRAAARLRRTRRASSFLPLKRGTRDRSSLLDPRIERIVEEQIERFWLKKGAPVQRAHGTRSRRLPRRGFAGTASKNDQSPRHGSKPDGGGPPKRAGRFEGVYPKPRPVCRRPS